MPSIILNFTYVANFPSVCSTYVPISSTHFIPSQLFSPEMGWCYGLCHISVYLTDITVPTHTWFQLLQYTRRLLLAYIYASTHACISPNTRCLSMSDLFSFDHLNKPRPNGRPLGNPNICKSTQLLHASFPVASSCCYRADPFVCRSSPESRMTLLSDVSTA